VVWHLDPGRVNSYNLDAVRQYERWPLCLSPEVRYLVCRTKDGLDVSDAETGKSRGELAWRGLAITAAVVNHEGMWLAVGDYVGKTFLFEIITSL